MAIFGFIKSDDVVFAGDKIRFDFSQSFLSAGTSFTSTLSHEFSVDLGVTWYDVSAKKTVDWAFASASTVTVTLRLSTTEPATQTFTKVISVLDLTAANLFSKDFDLYQYEPDIDQYLPKKWSSWNIVHKNAQSWIVDWLDEKGIFNENGAKYTAADIMDKQQVKQLSCYKVLEMIFEGNSNVVGDLFSIKRDKYRALASEKASRSQLSLDFNANAVADVEERTNIHTILVRRG